MNNVNRFTAPGNRTPNNYIEIAIKFLLNLLMIKKLILLMFICLSLNSCANMTAQDWKDIEQGLRGINCALYQTDC